jgi:hypothetical protein
VYAPEVLLLRRHTTPLFSASLRSVAVETPATPPVLQTAPLGASGPGMFAQSPLPVQVVPLTLQVPTLGQFTRSMPGVVQAMLVIAHTPPVGGHWLSLVQSAPLLLHFPTFGQSWFW